MKCFLWNTLLTLPCPTPYADMQNCHLTQFYPLRTFYFWSIEVKRYYESEGDLINSSDALSEGRTTRR